MVVFLNALNRSFASNPIHGGHTVLLKKKTVVGLLSSVQQLNLPQYLNPARLPRHRLELSIQGAYQEETTQQMQDVPITTLQHGVSPKEPVLR